MKLAIALLALHAGASLFALAGIIVMIPNPGYWMDSDLLRAAFPVAMNHGGAVHIVLGAAAMLAAGIATVGARFTLVFFAAAVSLSLGMELLGTGTGWPFGAYEYTTGLGYKLLGRVPFTIPLSWFYMGLASYLLARIVVARLAPAAPAALVVGLGVWLLTAWDLVLDPAMAHEDLAVRFWVWHQTGAYMGMPLINFAGWAATGAMFMGLARLAGGPEPAPERLPAVFLFAVYAVNLVFALALAASTGLWLPIVLALALGFVPTLAIWWRGRAAPGAVAAA